MGSIEHINESSKNSLDLRTWWKQIEKDEIETIMNSKDNWSYWWFNEDKTWITTLKSWKITNYKVNETEILVDETCKIPSNFGEKTKSEVLIDLFLSPENKVKDARDAYEKARYSNKEIPVFWFTSKWKDPAVIVLDFSQWKKPKITSYPLDKYNLKMKVVKI